MRRLRGIRFLLVMATALGSQAASRRLITKSVRASDAEAAENASRLREALN